MEREWELGVRDAQRRIRHGSVAWLDRLPRRLVPPAPPREFSIIVLSTPLDMASLPPSTALCVPGLPDIRLVGRPAPVSLPERLDALTLMPPQMNRYACGRILASMPLPLEPRDVFTPRSTHPRFDRLARALVASADAEVLAPYIAVLRDGLKLHPQEDALAALEIRLSPPDARERPPSRAPAVARLRDVLKSLRAGIEPPVSLEALAEDLRFLRLFMDDDEWSQEGLARLLDDLRGTSKTSRGVPSSGKVLPLRRRDAPEAGRQ